MVLLSLAGAESRQPNGSGGHNEAPARGIPARSATATACVAVEIVPDGGYPKVDEFLDAIQATPEERAVSAREAANASIEEIAGELIVSENTIRFHLKNIYEKLGVTNRTEAVAWYFRTGKG